MKITSYLLSLLTRMSMFPAALALCALAFSSHAFSLTTQPIQKPSTYRGSLNGEPLCATSYNTAGYEPYDSNNPDAKYPLFLYFIGTAFYSTESRDYYKDAPAPQAALQAMAARGFVAVTVQYDNVSTSIFDNSVSIAGFKNKSACLFGSSNPKNALKVLCARRNVSCAAGIGVFGHSQGAEMALQAANYDKRVNAAFATGDSSVAGMTHSMAYNRIRLVNAEHDFLTGYTSSMYPLTGTYWLDCIGQSDECLRADGSGWIMVKQSQLTNPSLPFYSQNGADHCWFFTRACDTGDVLEPKWTPDATYPFSLAATADWLASAAVKARICPSAVVALRSSANNLYVSARLFDSGTPMRASALFAAAWEKFSCMDKGDGKITLQANNASYAAADPGNYQLAADTDETDATTFQYIDLGNNNIALKAVSNGRYMAPDSSGQLLANQDTVSKQATFTIVPQ